MLASLEMASNTEANNSAGSTELRETEENLPPETATSALPPLTSREQTIVILSTFFAIFQTIGPNLSYGIFQSYYTSSPDSPIPPSEWSNKAFVAFVGTLGSGLTWGGSIYVGPMLRRAGAGGEKRIAIAGAICVSLGFLLASFSKRTWHLLFTQGLVYGIGSSLLYFPLVGTAPTYFGARRGTAMGVILSAAGVGGLTYSLLLPVSLNHIGARWTLRIMALENLIVSLAVGIYAQPSRNPSRASSMVDLAIIRKPAFVLQALGALLQAAGNFVPMTFTPEFSGVVGYSVGFGAVLLAINNGVNAVSRILTGVLADDFGRQNVLILSVVGSAISVLVLWLIAAEERAKEAWVTFVVLYGALAGGYMALFPVTITDIFGIQAYASINSFIYFVRGIGAVFGSPVGGQILGDSRNLIAADDLAKTLTDYKKLILYDGALLVGSSVCVVAVRGLDAAEKKHWRWKA